LANSTDERSLGLRRDAFRFADLLFLCGRSDSLLNGRPVLFGSGVIDQAVEVKSFQITSAFKYVKHPVAVTAEKGKVGREFLPDSLVGSVMEVKSFVHATETADLRPSGFAVSGLGRLPFGRL